MPEPGSGSPLLRLLAPIYAAGAGVYHGLYDRGILHSIRLPVPVLSVGNLVVGGSGKTPAVMAMAREFSGAGINVVILSRGYRGNRTGVLRAGVWNAGGNADFMESGDEPLLLSRALPTVPLLVHPNRSRAALEYIDAGNPVDVFLLDDGFQHRALARDRNLVIVDADRPFGNGRVLPAGTLRESPRALARADHLLIGMPSAGGVLSPEVERLLDRYAENIPRTPIWPSMKGVAGLPTGDGPPSLDGLEVMAVSGIARPERFHASLQGEGAILREKAIFRDHHSFSKDQVAELEIRARERGLTLITTTKDAVRLEELVSGEAGWAVLEAGLEVEGGWRALLIRLFPGFFPEKESGTTG